MQWLNAIVDELITRHPEGEIIVSSGVSPSGTYHLGTLREVLTAEVILRELQRRGRSAKHIHVVDDLDIFRKVPVDVSGEYEKYLGKPLCDVPAPDGSDQSYADYFLADLAAAAKDLHLEMEIVRAHQKYRQGFFVPAIEKALEAISPIKKALEEVSGRILDADWTPIQVLEDGYLKNRRFVSIDTDKKQLTYIDKHDKEQHVSYAHGEVKLNWRVDWPARWWLMEVQAEPFGRDHATKGGSYDTGAVIARDVFGIEPPLPLPYNFINRVGDTKKMSKSKGDVVTAVELLKILPAEVVWFFVIRSAPDKLLFFDEGDILIRLVDEFSELLAKPDKTEQEQQLLDLCLKGVSKPTVSNVPFSHLVASYQAALKDPARTLEIIKRTEHVDTAKNQEETIKTELAFIDEWLKKSAPDEVKFELVEKTDTNFTAVQKEFLAKLADKIEQAPADTDGEWFHKVIYDFKETSGLQPRELFTTLYQVTIGKDSGPRAGWFLSMLPRDWLIKRLRLEA